MRKTGSRLRGGSVALVIAALLLSADPVRASEDVNAGEWAAFCLSDNGFQQSVCLGSLAAVVDMVETYSRDNPAHRMVCWNPPPLGRNLSVFFCGSRPLMHGDLIIADFVVRNIVAGLALYHVQGIAIQKWHPKRGSLLCSPLLKKSELNKLSRLRDSL